MDSAVSSIVSRLGAGSGVDMVQLASDLAEARYATQVAQIESRNEVLEARISAASLLRNQLSQLASALGDRIRTGDLAPAPTIGNPSVAKVSVLPGSSPSGSYALEVTRLAAGQTLALGAYSDGSELVGEGTFTLRFGTVDGATFTADSNRAQVDIAVAADDTLATLANKINAANAGVTAYVANGTNGAQLVLKGAEGAQSGFVVETASAAATPSATPGDLAFLAWNPASDSGQLRQQAEDAAFLFDTVPMTSASNHVSDLPEGIELDLTSTNIGNPTQISFAERSSQVTGVMGDLVNALNDITAQLRESANALGGELGSDTGARRLKATFAALSSQIVMPNAASGEPRTLGDLGLSLNRDGSFRLDAQRLQNTLATSPQGAAAMFTTGLHGVFATIDRLARSSAAVGDPGSLAGSINRYQGQIERNDERLAKIAEQQDALRQRMTRTFVAADQRISLSNSTLSFLRAQIDLQNSQGN